MRVSASSHHVVPRAAQFLPRRVTPVSRAHGHWLRQQRQAHGWNVAQMARKLRAAATAVGDTLPDKDCLVVMIYRWESDRSGISERYRLHYCRAFQIPVESFGTPAAPGSVPASRTGPSGAGHAAGQHAASTAAGPSRRSPASEPAGPAGQSLSLRDLIQVEQLRDDEDRDRLCFLLGYVSALLTNVPRAPDPGEGSQSAAAASGEGDSRDD